MSCTSCVVIENFVINIFRLRMDQLIIYVKGVACSDTPTDNYPRLYSYPQIYRVIYYYILRHCFGFTIAFSS